MISITKLSATGFNPANLSTGNSTDSVSKMNVPKSQPWKLPTEPLDPALLASRNWVERKSIAANEQSFQTEIQFRACLESIRKKLKAMDDGTISPSAYDTAWVARIPALHGPDGPQFPRTIEWLLDNQNLDGSWGEQSHFSAYDRVVCTLSCIIALKKWNRGHENIRRGIRFLSCNVQRLEDEPSTCMPCGFEIVFLPLLEEAKSTGLQVSDDLSHLKTIIHARAEKLKRIPMELLHSRETTLLYSLEGLQHLVNWERIMILQSKDGSLLGSPAATACAFIHTGDSKCLNFLTSTLSGFNDEAVPMLYPIDLFERLWLVDTIERLGISRFFQTEIKDILDYVYRYWTPQGIGWARDTPIQDLDNTSMAFRLLRIHGYNVSAGVFEHFRLEGKFACLSNEYHHGVTDMLDLYRASQVRFPDEVVLREAGNYAEACMIKELRNVNYHDKWSLKKDFRGEVSHALKYAFYTTYPRIDVRMYLEQYGPNDVWIGKSIYRLPSINNQTLFALAKMDFQRCQTIHQKEIDLIRRWWEDSGFTELSFAGKIRPLEIYFSIGASMFEPEFAILRIAYTKITCLATIVEEFCNDQCELMEDARRILAAMGRWDSSVIGKMDSQREVKKFLILVHRTLNPLIEDASRLQRRNVGFSMRKAWETYVLALLKELEWAATNRIPTTQEYMENARYSTRAGFILLSCVFFGGEVLTDELLKQVDFGSNLSRLICEASRLSIDLQSFCASQYIDERKSSGGRQSVSSITCYMAEHLGGFCDERDAIAHVDARRKHILLELTRELFTNDNIASNSCKKLALAVTRSLQVSCQYEEGSTYSNEDIKREFIRKVLFEPVMRMPTLNA